MPKADRLLEVLLALHSRRRFTAQDLAKEFGVSRRTALRYLHELSEAGVPLAARPGPGGGYLVLQDRTLPLSFTVGEAVSLFFAFQSLRSYSALPFDAELGTALQKLYQHLPGEAKVRIDRLRDHLQFSTLHADVPAPHLGALLEASLMGTVVEILYRSAQGQSRRDIQPIGVYAQNGLWYCPAYCFRREAIRTFRVDRVLAEDSSAAAHARRPDIAALSLADYHDRIRSTAQMTWLEVELTETGLRHVEHMGGELVPRGRKKLLRKEIERSDIPLFARTFLDIGEDARVVAPAEMVDLIRDMLRSRLNIYGA